MPPGALCCLLPSPGNQLGAQPGALEEDWRGKHPVWSHPFWVFISQARTKAGLGLTLDFSQPGFSGLVPSARIEPEEPLALPQPQRQGLATWVGRTKASVTAGQQRSQLDRNPGFCS